MAQIVEDSRSFVAGDEVFDSTLEPETVAEHRALNQVIDDLDSMFRPTIQCRDQWIKVQVHPEAVWESQKSLGIRKVFGEVLKPLKRVWQSIRIRSNSSRAEQSGPAENASRPLLSGDCHVPMDPVETPRVALSTRDHGLPQIILPPSTKIIKPELNLYVVNKSPGIPGALWSQ
ncbi:hypothetical protein QBC43DRAFT_286040 [Cladorrhinum sp. PSN259]|nr:hypothetical protein QBC43DRAFT_286040 [Cladorrhinum sp. PSN259]